MKTAAFISTILLILNTVSFSQTNTEQHRVIILTDIEADPDDAQSLIRLLLYANSIDIKGLVATTSVHQKSRVAPESIRNILQHL